VIRVGTAGWSYADWEGVVYPKPRPRDFHPLDVLLHSFQCVELNSDGRQERCRLEWVASCFDAVPVVVKLRHRTWFERGAGRDQRYDYLYDPGEFPHLDACVTCAPAGGAGIQGALFR